MEKRNILITGATSGLGLAIFNEIYYEYLFGIRPWMLAQLTPPKSMFTEYHDNFFTADVTDWSTLEEVVEGLDEKKIKISGLINCAGMNYINWIEDTGEEQWDKIMNTNAKGIFLTTKAFLPHLQRSKDSFILNIVSNAYRVPMTNSIAYNASKGAAYIMTKQMARELEPKHGITVFGINPNKLENTAMSKYIDNAVPGLRNMSWTEAKSYQLKTLAHGVETKPEWIAELVCWLIAEPQRYKYLSGCLLDLGR